MIPFFDRMEDSFSPDSFSPGREILHDSVRISLFRILWSVFAESRGGDSSKEIERQGYHIARNLKE